jgi:hypothetical protein
MGHPSVGVSRIEKQIPFGNEKQSGVMVASPPKRSLDGAPESVAIQTKKQIPFGNYKQSKVVV